MSTTETQNMSALMDRQIRTASNGVWTAWSNAVRRPAWVNTVTKGGPVPHWRTVIARGQNATTNMAGIKTTCEYDPGYAWALQQNRFQSPPSGRLEYEARGGMIYLGAPSFSLDMSSTSADNQALTRYYKAVNAVSTKFSGLVFSGELRESLAMIKSPAKKFRSGIVDYLSHLERYGPRVARRRRKSFLRETWLEYSFGWKPLISDIDNAIGAFYSSDVVRPIFEMVKGSGRAQIVKTQSINLQDSNGILTWAYDVLETEEVYVQYRGIYRSAGDGVPDSHHYGFKITEFIPTAWELIPYSFLVDYFTNIGDIVSSWSYRFQASDWTARLQRREGVKTSLNERVVPPTSDATFLRQAAGHPGRHTYRKTDFVRTASVTPSIPSLELQVPGMDSRWVNILALSKQTDRTRRRLQVAWSDARAGSVIETQ